MCREMTLMRRDVQQQRLSSRKVATAHPENSLDPKPVTQNDEENVDQ